jgi:hypothetical protein
MKTETTIKDTYVTSNHGFLYYGKYKTSPIFYHIKDIKWNLFLSIHFKTPTYYSDNEDAERNRRLLFKKIISETCDRLNLATNDLQYVATTEKQQYRCHYHSLIYIKKKSNVCVSLVRQTIQNLLNEKNVAIKDPSEKGNQIVIEHEEVAAYISKFNKNDMDCIPIHHSKKFIRFVENYRLHEF